jgi:hypothetical protein
LIPVSGSFVGHETTKPNQRVADHGPQPSSTVHLRTNTTSWVWCRAHLINARAPVPAAAILNR